MEDPEASCFGWVGGWWQEAFPALVLRSLGQGEGGFSLESRTLAARVGSPEGMGLEVGAKTTAKWLPSLFPHLLWLLQMLRDSQVSGQWGEENPQREEERNRKAEVGGGSPGVSARGGRTQRN